MSVVFDTSYISEEFINDNETYFFSYTNSGEYILDLDIENIERKNISKIFYDFSMKELLMHFERKKIYKNTYNLVLKDLIIYRLEKKLESHSFYVEFHRALTS